MSKRMEKTFFFFSRDYFRIWWTEISKGIWISRKSKTNFLEKFDILHTFRPRFLYSLFFCCCCLKTTTGRTREETKKTHRVSSVAVFKQYLSILHLIIVLIKIFQISLLMNTFNLRSHYIQLTFYFIMFFFVSSFFSTFQKERRTVLFDINHELVN